MATLVKPETEVETEGQTCSWEGTAGVGELTLEGPAPTLGGRAQATYRRTHDQLRALGLTRIRCSDHRRQPTVCRR